MTFRAVCASGQDVILRFGSGLFSLLSLARNLVWLTAGPFGAPFRRGRSSRFGQIWKRGPDCQGALRWRCRRIVRENSSPINGENQRFWKHLSKIFLPGRNSRCTFSQTPLTPTWEKSGKMTPPPENFFSTRIVIVVFSLHS